MGGTIELPIWLVAVAGALAAAGLLDRVLAPSARWVLQRRLERAVEDLNQRLQIRIQPFKLVTRKVLIDRIVHDPAVARAAEIHAAATGEPPAVVAETVERYARQIVPSFSAYLYFSVGTRIARWVSTRLYDVQVARAEAALEGLDAQTSVVFVMNHRSNVDYLLVTYLASERSALSYAVGEWAQIWPLNKLVRAMGAYFLDRRARDDLYRAVLRRYVGMATEAGVTQAIFPEGGLTRDGALHPAKLGLLSYIVDGFDPAGPRDVVFVPVGIAYDRVLEDRVLTRGAALARGAGGPVRFRVNARSAAGFFLSQVWLWMRGRWRRFGHACVGYGAPLSLRAHLADGGDVAGLGAALMRRVGRAAPVAPTPLVADALLSAGAPVSREDLIAAARGRVAALAAAGVTTHLPDGEVAAAVASGLDMLLLRKLVVERDGVIAVVEGEMALLRYYAASMAHLGG